jgi:hypothetical protein
MVRRYSNCSFLSTEDGRKPHGIGYRNLNGKIITNAIRGGLCRSSYFASTVKRVDLEAEKQNLSNLWKAKNFVHMNNKNFLNFIF